MMMSKRNFKKWKTYKNDLEHSTMSPNFVHDTHLRYQEHALFVM